MATRTPARGSRAPQPTERAAARRAPGLGALGAALWIAASLCSCQVQRAFVITSKPPGAKVRVDDDLVGTTPITVPFQHYGVRRITAYLDGYLTNSRVLSIEPPWYDRFPLDVVSEVLVPIGWRDRRRVHFDLVAGTGSIAQTDLSSALERAETLRSAGPSGPLPAAPIAPTETPPQRP